MRLSEDTPPDAKALVKSMRAFGYDLQAAISDIIDNSIFAGAKSISIKYSWNEGEPYIMICDDGIGMDESELKKAMKPGSQSPDEKRDEGDLGRFGLGLKTASWAMCKKMTVMSKKKADEIHYRQWDLDVIVEENKWSLLTEIDLKTEELMKNVLNDYENGTIVLWENLDRILGKNINEDAKDLFFGKMNEIVLPHLSMIFHRFLEGKDKIKISVGFFECSAWDPFLSSNKATERRTTEPLDGGKISITPFILPHNSHLTEREREDAKGPKGWNGQQGFYIYRNKRMIISGGYLGLLDKEAKPFEPKDGFRLCRISVDLPNDLDEEWEIDVRKESATPPLRLQKEFIRIAESAMQKSSNVYRRRTKSRDIISTRSTQILDIWNRKKIGGKFLYKVNRKSPAIEAMREKYNLEKNQLDALLHLVERNVPYRAITVDNNDITDSTVDLPDQYTTANKELLEIAEKFVKEELEKGKDLHRALDYITGVIMPLDNSGFRIELEKRFERGD